MQVRSFTGNVANNTYDAYQPCTVQCVACAAFINPKEYFRTYVFSCNERYMCVYADVQRLHILSVFVVTSRL